MDWLEKLTGLAAGAYSANQASSATRSQANAQAAVANAQAAQSSNRLKIALIGGGVLLVIGVAFAFLRGK